jgi:glycerol-3-phosphate dehydrogenase
MTVSILGCGWYGLPLAKTLVAKGINVKGSTTSAGKLETLAETGIKPFLIDLSADDAAYNPSSLLAMYLLLLSHPKAGQAKERSMCPSCNVL